MARHQWVILCSILTFLAFNAGILSYSLFQCARISVALKRSPIDLCPDIGKNYAELGTETLAILLALGAFSGVNIPPPKL